MERDRPDFDQEDSGVPVTTPDRNPDPLQPEHDPEPGAGGGSAQGGADPADAVQGDRTNPVDADSDEEPARSVEGGPAVPGSQSGIQESNPAEGL
jgi:hypothetical protein